jgi:hypothetical protein
VDEIARTDRIESPSRPADEAPHAATRPGGGADVSQFRSAEDWYARILAAIAEALPDARPAGG